MLRPIYRAPSLSSHFCPLPLASFASPTAAAHLCRASVYRWEERAPHLRCFQVPIYIWLTFTLAESASDPSALPPAVANKAPISAGLLAPPSQPNSQLPHTHSLDPQLPPACCVAARGKLPATPPTLCQCPGVPLTGTACSCHAAISVLIGTLAATLVAATTLLALRGQPPPAIPLSYPFHNIAPSAPHPILPE